MSAYVVSRKTINTIVTALKYDGHASEFGDFSDPEACQTLVDNMLAMNRQAVSERYDEPIDTGPGYRYRNEPFTKIEAYKMLRSYLYQCTEGSVPEQKLYKQLDELSTRWAHAFVKNLPEYRQAYWG